MNLKKHELKKHVATIHSNNKLSLIQRKIANALLFNAYPYLNELNEYQISIKELCVLTGYDSHDYKTIKKALIALLSTVIEWNLVDGSKMEGSEVWNASTMIADARIDGSVCTYSYSNRMRELLFNPMIYGRLNMLVQAKFKSSYGLALYENCVRYQNIKNTPWFKLDLFRKLMGIECDKYPIFRDLKRRVIDIAVREVNELSNITIETEYEKQFRNVVALRFLIESNQEKQIKNLEIHSSSSITEKLRNDFGCRPEEIIKLMKLYNETYILEKIAAIKKTPNFKEGKILDLSKYLKRVLKNNETNAITAKISNKDNKSEQNVTNTIDISSHYESLDEKEKKKLIQAFEGYIQGTLYSSIFKRDGLNNILIQDQFKLFLKREIEKK